MMEVKTDSEPKEYSQHATTETLLQLIEKSNNWLKKMERDSLIIIGLLIIFPIVSITTVLYGNGILQWKMALFGDFFIPGVVIGVIVFLIILLYIIRRHLMIRKEIKSWQGHLHTIQRNTEDLLSKL
jgi:pilus assembly protein TadC